MTALRFMSLVFRPVPFCGGTNFARQTHVTRDRVSEVLKYTASLFGYYFHLGAVEFNVFSLSGRRAWSSAKDPKSNRAPCGTVCNKYLLDLLLTLSATARVLALFSLRGESVLFSPASRLMFTNASRHSWGPWRTCWN